MTHMNPEQAAPVQLAPEEVLLQRALDIDPTTADPDQAIPPIEEAIFACNQLIWVFQSWKEVGLIWDHVAIKRASGVYEQMYAAQVELSENEKESNRRAIGWGWDPGHVAALGFRKLLLSKHQEISGLSDEGTRAFYSHMGQNDLHYLLPIASSR